MAQNDFDNVFRGGLHYCPAEVVGKGRVLVCYRAFLEASEELAYSASNRHILSH